MTMNANNLFNELREFCIANANEKVVEKYSRYFKEGFDAYGLTTELLLAKVDEIASREDVNLDLILNTADFLIPTGKYEAMSFAFALTNKYKKEFTKNTFLAVESWFDKGG